MGLDVVISLILMECRIGLCAFRVKRKRLAVQTIQILLIPQHHVAVRIEDRLLCPLVMLEHQVFQRFSVIRIFTR